MSKPTTHVLHIIDMSGSMNPRADDVRGGFNTYVEDLRRDTGRYRLTAVLFDDLYEPLCTAAKLRNVPALTDANYRPRGSTALLDAVGRAIAEMVRQREATGRWSFLFLGAGIDAWAQAGALGFARHSTISVDATGEGTRASYTGLSKASVAYAAGASAVAASGMVADTVAGEQ